MHYHFPTYPVYFYCKSCKKPFTKQEIVIEGDVKVCPHCSAPIPSEWFPPKTSKTAVGVLIVLLILIAVLLFLLIKYPLMFV